MFSLFLRCLLPAFLFWGGLSGQAAVVINGLTNVSVLEGHAATFSFAVEAEPPLTIQWFRNRQPLPGENRTSYTIPHARLTNDVDLYSVTVSNATGVARAEAVLSVLTDLTPPEVLGVMEAGLSNRLVVIFSEAVEETGALLASNYEFDGATPAAVRRRGATTVELTMAKAWEASGHFLRVRNLRDLADPGNVIRPAKVELEAGLQAWLKFDEAGSTNAVDSSGQGHTAVLHGEPLPVEKGVSGGALNFDGQDDDGQFAEGMADFANGLTVAVWARPEAVKGWGRVIDFANGPGDDNILFGRLERTRSLFFEVYKGHESGGKVMAPQTMDLHAWQHFAVTLDGTGFVRLYKNGEEVATGQTAVPQVVKRKKNFIARSNWTWEADELYEGALDDLRVYGRSLSPAEIRVLAGKD